MPARPSIAAAVEPARPPPTMAISVYRMPLSLVPRRYPRHYHCAAKGKQTLKDALWIDRRRFRLNRKAMPDEQDRRYAAVAQSMGPMISVTIDSPDPDIGPHWDDLI